MKVKKIVLLLLIPIIFTGTNVHAEEETSTLPIHIISDLALVTKYLWRGQRCTNDWSLQPSATIHAWDIYFNIWGNMDLTAVNEGNIHFIGQNPEASSGNNDGMRNRFSEIDYTLSYSKSFEKIGVEGGAIVYTFPERSTALPATTELYCGASLISLPLSPSLKIFVDVDETRQRNGDSGTYIQLSGKHTISFNNETLTGIDLSGWISVANNSFSKYYYGKRGSGFHDLNLTASLPIVINKHVQTRIFASYSALIGKFRDRQYADLRDVYNGKESVDKWDSDSFWGGIGLNVAF